MITIEFKYIVTVAAEHCFGRVVDCRFTGQPCLSAATRNVNGEPGAALRSRIARGFPRGAAVLKIVDAIARSESPIQRAA